MVKDINKSNLLIFGENFKDLRIKSDLSYRKLSQLCDVDYSGHSAESDHQIPQVCDHLIPQQTDHPFYTPK